MSRPDPALAPAPPAANDARAGAKPRASNDAPLLELDDLRVTFDTSTGPVRAVDGVSWRLGAGETLGIEPISARV